MNKNTLIGGALLLGLLVWSMVMSPDRNKDEATAKAKAESSISKEANDSNGGLTLPSEDSLKAGSAVVLNGKTPELAPLNSKQLAEATLSTADSTLSDSTKVDSAKKTAILPRKIKVETDNFIVTLDNRGAKISSIIVKTLADSAGVFPEIIEDTLQGALGIKLDKADLSTQLFAVDANIPNIIKVENDIKIVFTFSDANNNKVIREYSFTKKGISVGHVTRVMGFQPNDYELSWNGGMRETERFPKGKSFGGASYYFSEVTFNNTYSVERQVIKEKTKFNASEGKLLWAGMRRKYIAAVVKFPEPTEASLRAEPLQYEKTDDKDPGTYKIVLSDYMRDTDSLAFDFMILPLEWKEVSSLGNGFEKIIVSGWTWCGADVWFVAICGFLLSLLKIFYGFIPNYGVAIILLTILVKLITTPLTVKQLRSTKEMSKIKPEIDAINIKYRAEPQKKQAAIMELYSKHNINPMASCTGGCLPMLIQMPIFFGLFMVFGRAIELRGMPFIGWISDLSSSDVIFHGFSIPYLMPDGLAILPIVMVFTTYFQTKQSMVAMTDPAQRKMMTIMMPAMMFFFSAVMPSGLVLYWIISNLWGIGQYAIINRNKAATSNAALSDDKSTKIQDAKIVKRSKKK